VPLKQLAKNIAQAKQVKTLEQEFLYMLTETISLMVEKEKRKPSLSYKPSSLAGCPRNIYFQVTGITPDEVRETATGIGIQESGTDRHLRLQKAVSLIRQHGFDCDWIPVKEYLKVHPQPGTVIVKEDGFETKCKNTVLNLSFMCDGIIRLKSIYCVLEIKTEASFKWMPRYEIEIDHKIQAACYSIAFGIDRVIFLYEDRDLCRKKPYLYNVTNRDKEELVIAKIESCENHIRQNTVPPKSDRVKDCTYCRYKKECRKY